MNRVPPPQRRVFYETITLGGRAMKFNVYYTIEGAGGRVEAPNTGNPCEADSLADAMRMASEGLDRFVRGSPIGLFRVVGARLEEA